jgi:TolB-like protein/DNA-binding winged helix-turn-helix (wHTH) protein/tetratricopeptide (TPR) repeat protein
MTSPIDGVSFGLFELNLTTGELRKSGRVLKVQPQPLRVLRLLVESPGKLVTREEIRNHVWGDSTFVDYDSGVDYCVNRLRSVLGDKVRSPRYIETIPRCGYRFIAPVVPLRPFTEPILAVLPFANLNGDPAKEYFADGITDVLITELARVPSLRVISRQSVLHLKGTSRKMEEIARDLRVDCIVEGAVLHEGNRVRVTAQLVLTDPERHVWAQSYDCDMSAVLTAQRDAAQAIAMCVASALRPSEAATPISVATQARPVVPEIIEAYLMARAELGRMDAEGIGKALRYLREISIKAPEFAVGLAWYALCLGSLAYWGHLPIHEAYPSAKRLAMTALAIDESNVDAHIALGLASFVLDWDLAAAEREFRHALKLAPSNPDVHILYAIFLSSVGRLPEAGTEIEYALKLDSASLLPNSAAAWIYLHQGRYEKALDQARRTLEMFPDSIHAHFVLGWGAWNRKKGSEAVAAFETALALSREAFSLSFLGHIYGCIGRKDEAISLLRELEGLFAQGYAPPMAFVIIHAGLGNMEAAFEWLETAYRLRDDKLFWLSGMQFFDSLRTDPRIAATIDRISSLVTTG